MSSQEISHISLTLPLVCQLFLSSHDSRIVLSQPVHHGKIRVADEYLQPTGHYLCGHRVVGEFSIF